MPHQGETFLRPIPEDRSEASSMAAGLMLRRLPLDAMSEYATSSTRANLDETAAPSILSSVNATVAPEPPTNPLSEPNMANDKCRNFWTRRNITLAIGALVLVAGVVGALAIVATFAIQEEDQEKDQAPVSSPTRSPAASTQKPTFAPSVRLPSQPVASSSPTEVPDAVKSIDSLLSNISDPILLYQPNSSQYLARQWMIHDDWLRDDVVDGGTTRILQRYLLALLNFALGSSNYSLPDHSECDWTGITCGDSDNIIVTRIKLKNSAMQGSIPSELKYLTTLQSLDLSSNLIHGPIFNVSQLSSLVTLDLSYNKLTGSIPPEIWSLAAIEYVFLNDNSLTGTVTLAKGKTPTLGLQDIRLRANQLTGALETWILNLPSLTVFTAGTNDLSGQLVTDLPVNLTFLDLSWNNLTGRLPNNLLQLELLTHVYLEHNQLTGSLPARYTNRKMVELWLDDNQLTGVIPENFAQEWVNLTALHLHNNSFTGSLGPLNNSANELCSDIWPLLKHVTVDCIDVSCPCCASCAAE